MRKFLNVLCILFLLLIVLSCGGGKKGGKVEITYAIWDIIQEPYIRELVKKFEAENENVKVTVQMTPYVQYWTKLEAAATGGVIADAFWMNMPNVDDYAYGKIIKPLDEYIKKDGVDLTKYHPAIVEAYKIDGVQYSMPRDIDSTVVWYNKNIFDKAGVKYPTDDWTWDEMIEISKTIKEKVPGIYAHIITPNNGFERNYIYQNGGSIISEDKKSSRFDTPEVYDTLIKINSMIDEGLSISRDQIGTVSQRDMFQSDKVAMITDGSWWAKAFSENELIGDHIGTVLMPLMKDKHIGYSHGLSIAMSSKTKNPEETWAFIKFMTSKDSQDYIASNGVVIPAYLESQALWASSATFNKVDVSAHIRSLEGDIVPMAHSRKTQQWHTMANTELNEYWSGADKDLKSVLKRVSDNMNDILSKNK